MGRPGLSHHPKFLMLARTLGEVAARGVLELMWEVAYESGDDRLGSPDAVEAACRWRGERGVCFAALRDSVGQGAVGFIEEREAKWCIHDLWDHAPDYVRKRATREEQRRVKGRSLASERRPLTGQDPVSDRALTPPPAPAPAPGTQEDLPRAPPAPEVKSDPPRKKAPKNDSDPRHAPLVKTLCATYLRLRGAAYPFDGGRDAKCVQRLLARAEPAVLELAWERALQSAYPTVATLAEFEKWLPHFIGAAPNAGRAVSGRQAPDLTKGTVRAESQDHLHGPPGPHEF